MNATISVICFKSKTLANGEHPLMLRIIKDRKWTMKSLGMVHPDNWDFDRNEPKNKSPNRKYIQYQNVPNLSELIREQSDQLGSETFVIRLVHGLSFFAVCFYFCNEYL